MNEQQQHIVQQLNLETAAVGWRELQRFFANGSAIAVGPGLDLLEVAAEIVADNSTQVQSWMQQGMVGQVENQLALQWLNDDQLVWTVVVKPWVLVQARFSAGGRREDA